MTNRSTYRVLGFDIGTATGWDGEMEYLTLYDFVPVSGNGPRGDITIDYTEGSVEVQSPDKEIASTNYQLLDLLPIWTKA